MIGKTILKKSEIFLAIYLAVYIIELSKGMVMLVKNSMVFLVMAIFLSLKTSPITVYPKQKSANENSEFIKNVQ